MTAVACPSYSGVEAAKPQPRQLHHRSLARPLLRLCPNPQNAPLHPPWRLCTSAQLPDLRSAPRHVTDMVESIDAFRFAVLLLRWLRYKDGLSGTSRVQSSAGSTTRSVTLLALMPRTASLRYSVSRIDCSTGSKAKSGHTRKAAVT